MGYQQFHALLTSILLAGNLANANLSKQTFDIPALAEAAAEILDHCDFVRIPRMTSRAKGGAR